MHIPSPVSRPGLGIALLATGLVLMRLGRRIAAISREVWSALLGREMLARGDCFFHQSTVLTGAALAPVEDPEPLLVVRFGRLDFHPDALRAAARP